VTSLVVFICEIFIVTVGYKVTAKKSVGGIEADDGDRRTQAMLYNANTRLQSLGSREIAVLLPFLTSIFTA